MTNPPLSMLSEDERLLRDSVREFAEALLKARGEWADAVEAYVREREAQR